MNRLQVVVCVAVSMWGLGSGATASAQPHQRSLLGFIDHPGPKLDRNWDGAIWGWAASCRTGFGIGFRNDGIEVGIADVAETDPRFANMARALVTVNGVPRKTFWRPDLYRPDVAITINRIQMDGNLPNCTPMLSGNTGFIGRFYEPLPKGDYKLEITLWDVNSDVFMQTRKAWVRRH